VDDAVAVALKSGAIRAFLLGVSPAAGFGRKGGMGRKEFFLPFFNFFSDQHLIAA
jgi:hypothetical protein